MFTEKMFTEKSLDEKIASLNKAIANKQILGDNARYFLANVLLFRIKLTDEKTTVLKGVFEELLNKKKLPIDNSGKEIPHETQNLITIIKGYKSSNPEIEAILDFVRASPPNASNETTDHETKTDITPARFSP